MIEPGHDHTSRIIRARLFGVSDVRIGTRLLRDADWGSRGAKPLVLLLLLDRYHRATRDEVQERLWPDLGLDAGRNALYKAIHSARRALEPDLVTGRGSSFIVTTTDAITLGDEVTVVTDIATFQDDVRRAAQAEPAEARVLLRSALETCRGAVLEDYPYADWPVAARERMRATRESATLTLAALDLDAGAAGLTLPLLEALLQADPANEPAHRALMRAYLAQGERSLVLRQFERCRVALATQFGVEPDADTDRVANEARRATLDLAANRVAARRSPRAPSNLPAVPTNTVGRAREIDAIYDLLADSPARLLTIVGAGGVGKTRLAIEAANELATAFDGVTFVPLADLNDPDDVPGTVASVLGLAASGRRSPGDIVIEHLADRRMLLVLDNVEHLTAAAPWVATVLERCHRVKVIATSRVPLRIRAEQAYRIGGLDVPDLTQPLSPRQAQRVDAVALFSQVARSQALGFEIDQGNVDAIARICAALDGVPLALEIVASRTGDMAVADIESQLAQPLAMLVDGPVDLPARQRTLRDTIAWSYDLLAPDEQELLRDLGAFAGGAELDALRAVCGDRAEHIATGLVDANLARWQGIAEGRRLIMHQTLFEFAASLLDASPAANTTRRRHAVFHDGLASRAEAELRGADQVEWLDRLDRDIQNIRQSLAWCLDHGESELALRISGRIGTFWNVRTRPREGYTWMVRALAMPGDPWSAERASTAYRAARCAWFLDDFASQDRLSQEALDIWNHRNDPEGQAWGLNLRIARLWRDGNGDEAARLQRESIGLFRAAGSWRMLSDALVGLALASRGDGDDQAAVAFLRDALATVDHSGDVSTQAFVCVHLALQMHYSGEPRESLRYASEGERISWLLGDRDMAANAIYERAVATMELGDHDRALDLFDEADALFTECDTLKDAALASLYAAEIRLGRGEIGAAGERFGRAFTVLRDMGGPVDRLQAAEAGAGLALGLGRHRKALQLVAYARSQRPRKGRRATPYQLERLDAIEHAARLAIGLPDLTVLEEDGIAGLLEHLADDARSRSLGTTTGSEMER